MLDLVELGGFERKYPWQLSGGMQQRASIARALAFDADILLMDEPFGALDEIVRDRLNEELLALWARTEKTIAFVTHSIPEAVYLSTRIVVMSPRPGRVTDVIESPLPRRAAAAHPGEPRVPGDRGAGARRAAGRGGRRGLTSTMETVIWLIGLILQAGFSHLLTQRGGEASVIDVAKDIWSEHSMDFGRLRRPVLHLAV